MGQPRTSTILILLALVLLVAAYGLPRVATAIGWVFVGILAFLLLLFAAMLAGIWLLKRRMNRRLAQLRQAVADARAQHAEAQRQDAARAGAIDVEGKPKE